MPTADARLPLSLFLAASIVTFGCLAIMQFFHGAPFFALLVCMHGGIVLFIVSKRTFRAREFDMQSYFNMEYLMLLPFLVLMFYSIATSLGLVEALGSAKGSLVFTYSVICFGITFWNFRHMQRDTRAQLIRLANASVA